MKLWFLWTLILVGCKNAVLSPAFIFQNSEPALANFSEFTGDVRLCRAGSVNWKKVTKDVPLYPGDRVFTGKGGAAILSFTGAEASRVILNEGSIFVVAEELPISFHLSKSLQYPQLKWTQEKESNTLSSGPSQDIFNTTSGVRLDMTIVHEHFLNTRGNVLIHAYRWPEEIHLLLAPDEQHKMQGVLWENKKNAKAVWHSLEAERKFLVPVPAPGQYVFQAFDLKHQWKTFPVVIDARQIKEDDLNSAAPELLPRTLVAGDTVILP